jgi:hypothetical protein
VETHYYWPHLEADLREILRVLKPGGRLVVIAETYKGRHFDLLYRPAMMLLRATYLSVSEHRNLLSAAGSSEVVVFEERGKGWLCAVGTRPLQTAACLRTDNASFSSEGDSSAIASPPSRSAGTDSGRVIRCPLLIP